MAAIILLIRALAQGASGFIIDRAGHFDFLCSLIPGAASLEIGGDAHAINSWDVEDPARVGAEKIDYLLALHALLLGEHHAGRDSYGLTDLEANLLGLAIAEVYAALRADRRGTARAAAAGGARAPLPRRSAARGRSGSPRRCATSRCG